MINKTCFTPGQLAMYFADELSPHLCAVVERHLETCEPCSELAEELAECAEEVIEEEEDSRKRGVVAGPRSETPALQTLERSAPGIPPPLDRDDWAEQILSHEDIEEILRKYWAGPCAFVEPAVLEDLIDGVLVLGTDAGGLHLSQRGAAQELSKGVELISTIEGMVSRFRAEVTKIPSAELVVAALEGMALERRYSAELILAVVNAVLDFCKGK